MDSAEFDALEEKARAVLSPGAYAFGAAGAEDEITVAENVAAWRRLRLRPRVLNDIARIDMRTRILGNMVDAPIMVAPSGRHRLYHGEGECATASAAAATGVVYTLATTSTMSVEDVAARRKAAPQWFQLYYLPDRTDNEALVERVAAAGFSAIVLTVDQPVAGSSPRAARHPIDASLDIRHVNLRGAPPARTAYDPAHAALVRFPATWRDLDWLVRRSPLDVIVKGVLRADDALRCIDMGAKAVIVSNHGGRHLDTTVATAQALPEIADAIGGRGEVYVDGGIRRGTDVIKALALGARAVMIGRPVLWGLATGGADGVTVVLDHLKNELRRAMALCGVARLDEVKRDLVA